MSYSSCKLTTYSLLFLLLFGIAACQDAPKTIPGVTGQVVLGREMLMSDKASRIVVLAYETKHYDETTKYLKEDATPLAKTTISELSSPPYPFSLDVTQTGVKVFLMAFVDQDASGGDAPTSQDVYGFYPADPANDTPILLSGYRLENIEVTAGEIYKKPALSVDVSLATNITLENAAKKIIFGVWKTKDINTEMQPMAQRLPVLQQEITDLSKARWKFEVPPGDASDEVIPFAYLDQDNDGTFSKGDAYAVWSDKPINLSQVFEETISLTIKLVYEP
ncbi:MAG: hypothetical protein CL920_02545 [Deltaproteobacteria bacterium]|nr:hypothetical protein [Deltaproteobacteria bacterium]|tara:strand:- start:15014 stop:15847 length:834 start_codon:yes stop_codon:yes gene_type:complete